MELGLGTIRGNEYDQQATAVTANVTFWPRTVTVVMNRREEELANSPYLVDRGEVQAGNWGEFTLTFDRGRVALDQRDDVGSYSTSGGYTVDGKAITLHFTEGVNAGETFTAHWSPYRDVLTFKRLGELPTSYLVKPWRRIR